MTQRAPALDAALAEWRRKLPERIALAKRMFPRDPFAPYDPALDGLPSPPCECDDAEDRLLTHALYDDEQGPP